MSKGRDLIRVDRDDGDGGTLFLPLRKIHSIKRIVCKEVRVNKKKKRKKEKEREKSLGAISSYFCFLFQL